MIESIIFRKLLESVAHFASQNSSTTEESDDDWECEGVEVTNIFNILDDEINNEE